MMPMESSPASSAKAFVPMEPHDILVDPWWTPFEPSPERLYWQERFPVDAGRLTDAQDALQQLAAMHNEWFGGTNYSWRVSLNAGTGLPAFVRTRVPDGVLEGTDEDVNSQARAALNDPLLSQAIFGAEGAGDRFEKEFLVDPLVRLQSAKFAEDRIALHFSCRQYRDGFPVIGGSVRVHGVDGSARIAVTSSYFPIPLARTFRPAYAQEGEEVVIWRALLALMAARLPRSKQVILAALIRRFRGRWSPDELGKFLELLLDLKSDLPGRGLLGIAQRVLRALPALRQLVNWVLSWYWQESKGSAVVASLVPILDSDYAILPFNSDYHLVRRVRVDGIDDDPWYVDVDVENGQVMGEPWQAVAHSKYFQTCEETLKQNPGGPVSHIVPVELEAYLRIYDGAAAPVGATDSDWNAASAEATTVAAHAMKLHDYLCETCGVQEAQLQQYSYRGAGGVESVQTPGLHVRVGPSLTTGFDFAPEVHPKWIRFESGLSGGGGGGEPTVREPAKDPEVVLHELTHGFLWMLNRDPWDTPATLNPFGLALQEGYAMYLSRSLAAQHSTDEADQPWARAAYRTDEWGDQTWRLSRTGKKVGEDLLPAPNTYPAGEFSTESLQVYHTGMIWARALWDLRQILGPTTADWLAIQVYPYLHGYIANFELAAEGLLQADLQLADFQLANGIWSIWANRGIAAGQGVHGFARATNGPLIAATDAGILQRDSGGKWSLEQNNLSPSGTLTGAVVVEADDNTLYAAAQLPPGAVASAGVRWASGVFWRDATAGSLTWTPIHDWPPEATPLTLRIIQPGRLLIGTTHGVYIWDRPPTGASPTLPAPAPSGGVFNALGLAMVQTSSGGKRVRACSPTGLYQCDPSLSVGSWSWTSGTADLYGMGILPRLTGVTSVGEKLYVTALQGLRKVALNWTSSSVGAPGEAVLASTVKGNRLYMALADKVVYSDNDSTWNSLALPAGITVMSLWMDNDTLLAGTMAHGVWQCKRTNGGWGGWQQVYAPPLPSSLKIERKESALLSFMQPEDGSCVIDRRAFPDLKLNGVFQPGFPLHDIHPESGGSDTYVLSKGPVLLFVKNEGIDSLTVSIVISSTGSGNKATFQ